MQRTLKRRIDRLIAHPFSGIRRDDMSTWHDAQWPTTVHGAILSFHGIGQSQAQWFIRSRPRVAQGFAGVSRAA